MAGTAEGIGVPRFGAYYRYSEDQTQNLAVTDGGYDTHTVTNATASITPAIAVNYTYSGTVTSGYGGCYAANLTVGGTSSGAFGSQQHNAYSADVTVSGVQTGGIGGLYVYMSAGTLTATSAQIYGGYFDIANDFGATAFLSCITLDKHNTTLGTNVDAFILCQLQGVGATARSLIHIEGLAKPTYFVQHSHGDAGGYLDGVVRAAASSVASMAVRVGGTTLYISLIAGT